MSQTITEDDVAQCWPHYITYLTEILNGEYDLSEAKSDLLSPIGSKYDPRVSPVKVPNCASADEMNEVHGDRYWVDWVYEK